MRPFISVVAVAAALAGSLAQAQKKASVEDKRAETFNEIEQGFFFEVSGGYWGVLNPPALSGGRTYFSSGQAVSVEVGFDIGERVSPALFFMGTANRMGSDYGGLSSKEQPAAGDFGTIIPGASLKFRILGLDDGQDVKRVWLYGRARVGYVSYLPAALLPQSDVLITVGPGVEYYTRLRHFSIGVEASFNLLATTGSIGFSVFPTVRYSF
jgi:hypothetical protein